MTADGYFLEIAVLVIKADVVYCFGVLCEAYQLVTAAVSYVVYRTAGHFRSYFVGQFKAVRERGNAVYIFYLRFTCARCLDLYIIGMLTEREVTDDNSSAACDCRHENNYQQYSGYPAVEFWLCFRDGSAVEFRENTVHSYAMG